MIPLQEEQTADDPLAIGGRHRSGVDRAGRGRLWSLEWRPLFISPQNEGAFMNAETKTIRILTADDHALLRQGIAALVVSKPHLDLSSPPFS